MNDTPINTDDFFSAFDDSTDYQTGEQEAKEGTVEETAAAKQTSEKRSEQDAEASEDDEIDGGEETSAKNERPAQTEQEPEMFTLKVNKEEKKITRDEVIAYAQMGVDYERVKAAAEQAKSDNTALKEQNAKMQEGYDLLTQLAEDAKITIPELLDNMRANRYKGQGLSDDAAKERVAREKAEKALEAAKSETKPEKKETASDRAAREVAEFRKAYPDVDLSKELTQSLMGDVQAGMSLTQAYQKYDSARKADEIQQLKAELEAERKNRENRSTTPGSQSDSGAKRVKSQYDDFWDAFK